MEGRKESPLLRRNCASDDGAMLLFLSLFGLFLCLSLPPSEEISHEIDNSTYMKQRKLLMEEEHSRMVGNKLTLKPEEVRLNQILMGYKNNEIQIGFKTLDYSPAESFFATKDKINQSPVYSIIKKMPKGAALHLHDLALASVDWVVNELTYWEDLYICQTSGAPLQFRFFTKPDDSCHWELVSDLRATYSDTEQFDRFLMKSISILTDDPNEYSDINAVWDAFNAAFTSIVGLVSYAPAWESYLSRVLYEFMQDNVVYIEFRGVLPLLYEKNGKVYSEVETFQIYDKIIKQFTSSNQNNFYGAKYILTFLKIINQEEMWKKVHSVVELRNLFPDLLAGFDLVGQEDPHPPLLDFLESLLFLSRQDPHVRLFLHAGETNWHGMASDENLIDAILLNTTRIGHGFAITKHPVVLERSRKANISIEVCPISNQVLCLVEDLRNHPMAALVSDGYPIVISSDDPAMWGADPLSHDFYEAFYALGGAKADLKFLKQLAINSIEYSSLIEPKKNELRDLWQRKWDEFVHATVEELSRSDEWEPKNDKIRLEEL